MKRVWVEAYRPKSVDNIIMPDVRLKNKFKSFVESKNIPNILMYGGAGTGKTSMSMALVRDLGIHKMDVLTIRCSDEKIDALRDKVKGFATTMPFGDLKIVRLEEFDNIGIDAQLLLRSLIEDVSGSCRFIGTCNYPNKLVPALRSRFQEFEMKTPARDDVMVLGAEILEAESVKFSLEDLEKIVAISYPDVRKMIQLLESGSMNGTLSIGTDESVQDWKLDLITHLDNSDFKAARKCVCESASGNDIEDVFRFLYDNLNRSKKLQKHLDDCIVLIAQYQYQHAFAADKEINVAALFCELSGLAA